MLKIFPPDEVLFFKEHFPKSSSLDIFSGYSLVDLMVSLHVRLFHSFNFEHLLPKGYISVKWNVRLKAVKWRGKTTGLDILKMLDFVPGLVALSTLSKKSKTSNIKVCFVFLF